MRIVYPEPPLRIARTVELVFRLSDQTGIEDARAFLDSFMIVIRDSTGDEIACFALSRLPISYRAIEPAGRYFLRAVGPVKAELMPRAIDPQLNPHARDPFYTESFLHFVGDSVDGAHGQEAPSIIDFKGGHRD